MNTRTDEVSKLYQRYEGPGGTHLALQWKGRTRFTVPIETDGQRACWSVFHPGRLGIPLRAMARLPRLFNAQRCVEGAEIRSIRQAVGCELELSCCRAGAAGPWRKDTLLLLGAKTAEPLYFVKNGTGAAVDALLANEAKWLRRLRDEPDLGGYIPELVAHRTGKDFCFVAQRPLAGDLDFRLAEPQMDFLRKLQRCSRKTILFEDSRLFMTLASRLAGLSGRLSNAWAKRLETCMIAIERSLSGQPIVLVAAHWDFTPWNIRVENQTARVFDWEFADDEQLPLIDPLHFVLMPLALRGKPVGELISTIHKTLKLSIEIFDKELCYAASTQALAYLMSVCTLYLWSVQGTYSSDAVLDKYALVLDRMCRG